MSNVHNLLKNPMFIKSIKVQRHIVTDPQSFDPIEYSFEEEAPLDSVKKHNAFQILSQLDFPRDEVVPSDSNSRQYLDETVSNYEDVEAIVQAMITYRDTLK